MKDSPQRALALARDRARRLRNRGTDAERKLWAHLRNSQVTRLKFRRQYPVGPYVVDFLCIEARLVVEVDGGGHDTEEQRLADAMRSEYLESRGYTVARFWNNEVMSNIEGVLERIGEYA